MNTSVRAILEQSTTIAVCGMSRHATKPAHSVPAYMATQGYTIIPVNPFAADILGVQSYASLLDIPQAIDILNVFRPSEQAGDVVHEAVLRKKKHGDIALIWLQLGIVNEEARVLAEENNIVFVQDQCLYVEYRRHALARKVAGREG